jgi:hypothetical protein
MELPVACALSITGPGSSPALIIDLLRDLIPKSTVLKSLTLGCTPVSTKRSSSGPKCVPEREQRGDSIFGDSSHAFARFMRNATAPFANVIISGATNRHKYDHVRVRPATSHTVALKTDAMHHHRVRP